MRIRASEANSRITYFIVEPSRCFSFVLVGGPPCREVIWLEVLGTRLEFGSVWAENVMDDCWEIQKQTQQ